MKYGVLGSGDVGRTIAEKLLSLGHEVAIGTRAPQRLAEWNANDCPGAKVSSFADTAEFGETVLNCTAGAGSLQALAMAGADALAGKVLIDIANPLDFSKGMPPSLFTPPGDSLGEQIQRAYPRAHVVKTLNTVNAAVMVEPSLEPGEHDMFMCGNDLDAKARVSALLRDFGWASIIDLGAIDAARATEMYLPLWVQLLSAVVKTPYFNIRVVR